MREKLVSIILLTWNGKEYFQRCLDGIRSQDYQPIELIIVDNGSTDGTRDEIRKFAKTDFTIPMKIEYLNENTGFARGVNRGISLSSGDYILTLNQDVVMEPNYISNLTREIESDKNHRIGSICGKILKLFSDNNIEIKNEIIDSTGHEIFSDRIVEARGKGKSNDNYNEASDIFGVSASAALYNRTALEDVSAKGEYFDNDFFSYLEDIDLDYRLLLKGYRARYSPLAKARHAGAGSGGRKSFMIRFRAHTNRYLVWIKNEDWRELLKDAGPILAQETYQFLRTLVTSPLLLTSWLCFPSKARRARRKGKELYSKTGKDYARLRSFIQSGRLTKKFA